MKPLAAPILSLGEVWKRPGLAPRDRSIVTLFSPQPLLLDEAAEAQRASRVGEQFPTQEIREGGVVWIPPGQKHWHGATTSMTHIAIHESLEGKNVDWMGKVTDEQYRR